MFAFAIKELDEGLRTQIEFEGPLQQFCQLLVETLSSYGTLEDGQNALTAVLETAKNSVGQDKKDGQGYGSDHDYRLC